MKWTENSYGGVGTRNNIHDKIFELKTGTKETQGTDLEFNGKAKSEIWQISEGNIKKKENKKKKPEREEVNDEAVSYTHLDVYKRQDH